MAPPRKAFIVQRIGGEAPEKATLETVPHPRFADLPADILAEADLPTEGLKLSLPDGSEWFIEDEALDQVLALVYEHRKART